MALRDEPVVEPDIVVRSAPDPRLHFGELEYFAVLFPLQHTQCRRDRGDVADHHRRLSISCRVSRRGRLRFLQDVEIKLVLANSDDVRIDDLGLGDAHTVDVRAVGAVVVFNHVPAVDPPNDGMAARDRKILDRDLVIGRTPDGDHVLLHEVVVDDGIA